MLIRATAMLVVVFCGTCLLGCGKKAAPQPTPLAEKSVRTYNVGDVDESGRLVIFKVGTGADAVPFRLETTYGVVLSNDGDEKKPVPRYVLAFRKERRVIDTHSLVEFRKALLHIPRGMTVQQYDQCEVPLRYGLSTSQVAAYERSFRIARLRESENPIITGVDFG
ncbi:MAG: hypothetical protein ACHQ50_07435 [Fimbriimonadales bacterium]